MTCPMVLLMHCKDLGDVPVKLLLQLTGMWLQSLLPTQWAGLFHTKKHSLPRWKFISPLTCLLAMVSGGAGECAPTTALEPLINNVSSIPLTRIQVREYQQAVGKSCWRSQTSFFAGYRFAGLSHIDCKFLLSFLQLWKFCVTRKRELNSTNYAILHKCINKDVIQLNSGPANGDSTFPRLTTSL